jgi:hypothetical protein
MFCEGRGQLQYRIPPKDQLHDQYKVRGISAMLLGSFNPTILFKVLTNIFLYIEINKIEDNTLSSLYNVLHTKRTTISQCP